MAGPLRDAVEAYLRRDCSRFHTPGHKGRPLEPFGDACRYDITEVAGADSLYEASGPIAACEREFARLYGSAATLLSAGGATLCVQTMLSLAAPPGSRIICGRGVHASAIGAMALLNLRPAWAYPERDPRTDLPLPVTPQQVADALAACPEAAAVYLTSPDYFGVTCDIAAIAEVCRAHSVPLLVDNAHGAHLKFLAGCPGAASHPLDQGADLCCDSLHKTLPVLTGGAALHIRNPAYLPDAKTRMSLFGSTSPSYLILLSLDGILEQLRGDLPRQLAATAAEVEELERLAVSCGFALPAAKGDPLRLTLCFHPLRFTDSAFRAHLARHHIEPELCLGGVCVLLAGPHNTQRDFARLRAAILAAPDAAPPTGEGCALTGRADSVGAPDGAAPRRPWRGWAVPPLREACTLREAAFAPREVVPVERAAGRVAAAAVAPCPPGVPLVVPGEKISPEAVTSLKRYGFFELTVIK